MKTVIAIFLAALLTACGGGGDDDSSDVGRPKPPPLNCQENPDACR